jgi:hypothetical protein
MKKNGGFECIPDGVYNISFLSSSKIVADIKVDDLRELDLHRNNGITIISFDRLTLEGGYYYYDSKYSPDIGMLTITDWLNKGFIQ